MKKNLKNYLNKLKAGFKEIEKADVSRIQKSDPNKRFDQFLTFLSEGGELIKSLKNKSTSSSENQAFEIIHKKAQKLNLIIR